MEDISNISNLSTTNVATVAKSTDKPTAEELINELNRCLNGPGKYFFTEEEKKYLMDSNPKEMRFLANSLISKKKGHLCIIEKLATDEEIKIIKNGGFNDHGRTITNIINNYTDPESVNIDDMPNPDPTIWPHSKEALLLIFKELLKMLQKPKDQKQKLAIEKAIQAINHGKFSNQCQKNVNFYDSVDNITGKTKNCRKKIPIESFYKNPLERYCDDCRDKMRK